GTRHPSGDDVRRELVLQLRELVPKQKLPLFQPLQLQLIGLAGVAQSLDGRVEITVLFAQTFDLGGERCALPWRELPVDHLKTTPSAPGRRCGLLKAADYERAVWRAQGARVGEQVLTRVSPDVLSPLGMTMAPWKILRNVTGGPDNLNANAPF